MRVHSKTKLFADLAEIAPDRFDGVVEQGLEHRSVGDETYGRDSRIYLNVGMAERPAVERALLDRGHCVHTDYWPESGTVEVSVSFFKGWHWDE